MTGAEIIEMATNILAGEEIEQNFALQIINSERSSIETKRMWQVLKALDSSQTVSSANTWNQNPLNIPTVPKLRRFLKKGKIPLYNGTNFVIELLEIPFEDLVNYQTIYGYFAVDFANGHIYITGTVQQTCNAYIYYLANYGDITYETEWLKFPEEFHPYLAYMLAARWRLGVNYDDVAARNANDNYKAAQEIYKAMCKWDTQIANDSVNNLDYGRRNYPRLIAGRNPYPYPGGQY